jgi:YegS/Rv2252/BmrU family lipid kinase
MMTDTKKILMIYNQKAGISGSMNDLFQCIEYLSVHGYEVTIFPVVPKKGLTSEEIIKNTKGRFDQYFICGGDGTLNHAVNGFIDNDIHLPISYVPVGSTNDFSKSLYGNKNHTFKDICRFITHGKQYSFDVGQFNQNYFNYVAGFGVFPSVSYTTPQNMKNRLGYVAYVLNFLTAIPGGLSYRKHCKITHDGIVDEGDFMFGLITNSISVAGTQPGVIKKSSLNDGVFEALLIKADLSPIDVADMITSFNNDEIHSKGILTFQMKEATFEFDDEVPWTLDGEDGGNVQKAEIKVDPERISVFVPKKAK